MLPVLAEVNHSSLSQMQATLTQVLLLQVFINLLLSALLYMSSMVTAGIMQTVQAGTNCTVGHTQSIIVAKACMTRKDSVQTGTFTAATNVLQTAPGLPGTASNTAAQVSGLQSMHSATYRTSPLTGAQGQILSQVAARSMLKVQILEVTAHILWRGQTADVLWRGQTADAPWREQMADNLIGTRDSMAGTIQGMHALKAEAMTGHMIDVMTGIMVKHVIVIATGVETGTSGSGMTKRKR